MVLTCTDHHNNESAASASKCSDKYTKKLQNILCKDMPNISKITAECVERHKVLV